MDEKLRQAINFMEVTSLRIEKNVEDLMINLDSIEQFQRDYKGDTKEIDAELRRNETLQRVQEKIDKLAHRIF